MSFGSAPQQTAPLPVPPQAPAPPPMFGQGRVAQKNPKKPKGLDAPTFLGTPLANPTNTGMATLLGG